MTKLAVFMGLGLLFVLVIAGLGTIGKEGLLVEGVSNMGGYPEVQDDDLMALEDATVPHPDNHHAGFESIGYTVAQVEACTPFHGWQFKSVDGRQLKICDLGSYEDGRKRWAVNIKRADGSNITSIPKFGMKISSLVKYVWNSGYNPVRLPWGDFYNSVIAEFGL